MPAGPLSVGRNAVGSRTSASSGGIPTVSAVRWPLQASSPRWRSAGTPIRRWRTLSTTCSTTRPASAGAGGQDADGRAGSRRHLSLDGLTAPTVVIGSSHDRLLPIAASRRIAAMVPNLLDLVEVPGGALRHPGTLAEVNAQLRRLAQAAVDRASLSS